MRAIAPLLIASSPSQNVSIFIVTNCDDNCRMECANKNIRFFISLALGSATRISYGIGRDFLLFSRIKPNDILHAVYKPFKSKYFAPFGPIS